MTNKKSYNKIAGKWNEVRQQSFVSRLVIDFANKISHGGSILEIGCGSGFLTKYLCERNFWVTGIDFAESMIELAKSQQEMNNASFVVTDFFDYETSQKFDGVLAWDSFFHFPKERQESIYTKVGSLLNSGGFLLFTHGDADDEHLDTMFGEELYYSCLPKERVCQLLTDAGFGIEKSYSDFVERDTDRSLVILAKRR